MVWRDARRDDRPAIEGFKCTQAKPSGRLGWRKPHPKPWELIVQSGIRTEKPSRRDGNFLLGLDADGIAAVAMWTHVSRGDYKVTAIAVASRHRGKGGAHADEALRVLMQTVEGDAVEKGQSSFTFYAWIDDRNWNSQALFARNGFRKERSVDGTLSEWTLQVDTLGPAF